MRAQNWPSLSTGLGVLILAGSATGFFSSSKSTKVSGSAELTYSEQHALDVPDVAAHQLLAGETKGINKNTGGGDFMSRHTRGQVERQSQDDYGRQPAQHDLRGHLGVCAWRDPIEESVGTNSGLNYDAVTDQYTYVWKTNSGWTGCRKLILTLVDGSRHEARFSFMR